VGCCAVCESRAPLIPITHLCRLRHLTTASLPDLARLSRLFVLTLSAPLANGDAEGGELALSVARFHEVTPVMVEDIVRGMPFCDIELEHESIDQIAAMSI
jgi:hypothetical protein